MYCVMIGIKVFLFLSGTTIMNESLLPRSMPPNTQCPSMCLPRWYFLFPNLDSSISTVLPRPPIAIVMGWSRKCWPQTSRKKLYQSTAMRSLIFTSWAAEVTRVCLVHWYASFRMVWRDSLLVAKKLLSRMLMTAWQPLRGHLQYSVPFLFTIWHWLEHLEQSIDEARRCLLYNQ